MRQRLAAFLCFCLMYPSFASAQADSMTGIYRDPKITLTLAKGSGGYIGTIAMGDNVFPVTATATGKELTGTFSSGGTDYPFTGKLDGQTLVFKTGDTVYNLARQAAGGGGQGAPPKNGAPNGEAPKGESPKGEAPKVEMPQPPIVPRPPAAAAPPSRSEEIEKAIQRGRQFLLAQQKGGSWDLPRPSALPVPNARGEVNVLDIQNSSQWGGLSALATYALLAAGEEYDSPKMAAAIEFLKKADLKGTYSLAMRAQVWNTIPAKHRAEFIEFARHDRDLLMKNKRTDPADKGRFHYLSNDGGYDHSATQMAVLGMWACNSMGAEVPLEFWKETEEAWLKDQQGTGGWNYSLLGMSRQPTSPSMTAAGVATLFITLDLLHNDVGFDCRGNLAQKPIDAGIKWIADHYDSIFSGNNWPFYTLYAIERLGLASGYKYIGANDWYKLGTQKLLGLQQPDGSWGSDVSDTCFSLLFLVRGRNAVVMNKLQYSLDVHGDTPREGNWNQRPRDVSNFSKWFSHTLERELNWQIVNLTGPPEDLHDAPILFISGNQALGFSIGEEDKLRAFVEEGGLIVGHADCSSPQFATGFKKLGNRLFPSYEFRELPAGHLIFDNYFDRKKWKTNVSLMGLSNGARELMLLIPTGDPGRYWQTGAFAGHEPGCEMMANIFMYVNERKNLRLRGDSWIVTPSADTTPSATLKVARLEYAGNWNPEPGGWKRLAAVMHNEAQIDLTVEPVKLGDGKLKSGSFKIAHLTGTSKFTLSASQRAELKSFLDSGGTLIADATGGNGEAQISIETEIAAAAPGKSSILPADHKAFANLGMKPDEISYRTWAIKHLVGNAKGPRVRGIEISGRTAIIYSPEDLSVGLVGQPVDGISGYTSASATAIMKSLLIFAANQ